MAREVCVVHRRVATGGTLAVLEFGRVDGEARGGDGAAEGAEGGRGLVSNLAEESWACVAVVFKGGVPGVSVAVMLVEDIVIE